MVAAVPFGTQYANLPPDPEGEGTIAYTLSNTSGDPTGLTSTGYVLDDESVVVNIEGTASVNESASFTIDVDADTNTYSLTQVDYSADLPTIFAASVALTTVRKSDNKKQVKTKDYLAWRITNGQLGYTAYQDGYQVFPSSQTGGLTWTIVKSPQNPPYTTSPTFSNIFNDTGNGKYKNFNYGDPNLSTAAIHFIRLAKTLSDPDNIFRYDYSFKMKNEGKRHFYGILDINKDLP